MTESAAPSPAAFAWVYKRDGRLVPFEADKISRALFAASEGLGRPDALLARELTDGVLHFLSVEAAGATPSTEQVADMVHKVVRELGQPALAQAFADHAGNKHRANRVAAPVEPANAAYSGLPTKAELAGWVEAAPAPTALAWQAAGACLSIYTLREVFSRDLAAAGSAGLLTLTGLEAPLELAGYALGMDGSAQASVDAGPFEAIEQARSLTGEVIALDGPEYTLAAAHAETAGRYARELAIALRATRLFAVVNLNSAAPPPWAEQLAGGPLFEERRRVPDTALLSGLADALLDRLLACGQDDGLMRVDWHLGKRDFLPEAAGRLQRLARRATAGDPLAFVFDRPRNPLALAEGLTRRHPAVLLTVGLHLPRLAEQTTDPALFLQKLASLARLALSAAKQKRDFLRRYAAGRPGLARGFLLDRGRLVVTPVGLEAVARRLAGQGTCAPGAGRDFACGVVRCLREVLEQDGRSCQLDSCVDGYRLPALPGCDGEGVMGTAEHVAGVTSWEAGAPAKEQLRADGLLHAAAGGGTALLVISDHQPPTAAETADLLRWTWQHTEAIRVRFLRTGQPSRPTIPLWEEGRHDGS